MDLPFPFRPLFLSYLSSQSLCSLSRPHSLLFPVPSLISHLPSLPFPCLSVPCTPKIYLSGLGSAVSSHSQWGPELSPCRQCICVISGAQGSCQSSDKLATPLFLFVRNKNVSCFTLLGENIKYITDVTHETVLQDIFVANQYALFRKKVATWFIA